MAENILAIIAESKRKELAARFEGVSLDALRSQARPSRLRLADAIAEPGSRFILEIKKASPSGGAIRAGADAAAIARGYCGVADALSVLIDSAFFGGSLDDLKAARREFAGPILAKDVFLDPRQVAEARIAGADAVLVMLSLLDDAQARAIIAESERLGMDVLVEVHDEIEMRRANALRAQLIGINNRDLRDLSVDLRTTERLARLACGKVVIAESGIGARADVERLGRHVDGFLVGSSLMRSPDPAEAARALVFGRVKLCGLRSSRDLEAASPATFAGLVFVPESPRSVTLRDALAFAEPRPRRVGVFRDSPADEVASVATILGLAAVQLHGREDADYVRALARRLPPACEVWKSVRVGRSPPGAFDSADRLLFDCGSGGTGRTFDWRMVENHPRLSTALVAGGIGPANARSAAALGSYAIDVGSALDERPGMKSPAKIAALFDALRPLCRQELRQCA